MYSQPRWQKRMSKQEKNIYTQSYTHISYLTFCNYELFDCYIIYISYLIIQNMSSATKIKRVKD